MGNMDIDSSLATSLYIYIRHPSFEFLLSGLVSIFSNTGLSQALALEEGAPHQKFR